jgi:hypothetical protein
MLLNLIVSTTVFFIAMSYLKRYLDNMDIPQGMTRGILVFTLAMALAWGAGALINWLQHSLTGKPAEKIPATVSSPQ